MARIPEAEIERLKSEVSLLRLVEAKGIELKRHGKDWLGCCPFHDDKTPSLVISPDSNLWHCLGACNVGGSVIDWVMKVEGVSFRHAAELLLRHEVSNAPLSGPIAKKCTIPKLASPLTADTNDQIVLRRVVDYYRETLQQSPEALNYLQARGLNHPNLIETFDLGYANRTLGYRLPQKNRVEGAEIRGRLQRLGVYRDSGHEHLNGSLTVPLFDERGNVVQMYGRKLLGTRLTPGTPIHLYLPGPHAGIFNAPCLHTSKETILCEALIDALTFWCHGFTNVTSAYGVNGFTDEMLKAFIAHKIERVLIAFDRDEAGDKAAEDVAKKLIASGVECFRVQFPKGMDANEYALKVQPAKQSLGLVLRKAQWMGKGPAPERAHDIDHGEIELPTISASAHSDGEPVAALPSVPSLAALPDLIVEPSSPMPTQKPPHIEADVKENEVVIVFADRRYRVRGLQKNLSYEQLKINVLVSRDTHMHVDSLDLYSAKARQHYGKQASIELGVSEEVIKADLSQLLLKLEALQEQQIQKTLTPTKADVAIDDAARLAALQLLQAPDLLQRVLKDLHTCGVVGEETNKLTAYLACVSRKLAKPLAIIIQSTSAAGKSSLMDAVLNLMPDEERVQYSAMTGQSLFYMGETNLKHKILAIAEEEGASKAAYALKLLQSDGSLTIASTGKDATTGNLITQEYRVEGPVMIALTTTAIEIDEELLNRCVVLTVNESREQTRAIHALQRQRQTLAGLLDEAKRSDLIALHRNAQRLLQPLAVVNLFAEQLTFLDSQTRTRRDHMKYLTLIQTMALLHQYQREIKTVKHGDKSIEYIEVTREDIAMANKLAHEVLGRTLDELPPQTRKLLQLIDEMVVQRCTELVMKVSDFRFSRKDVRAWCGWSDFQVQKHLQRLEQMEYVLIHRGTRGQSYVYELLWDGSGTVGETFLNGLLDVAKLSYDEKFEPLNNEFEPPYSGQMARNEPPNSSTETSKTLGEIHSVLAADDEVDENAMIQNKNNDASYRNGIAAKPRA